MGDNSRRAAAPPSAGSRIAICLDSKDLGNSTWDRDSPATVLLLPHNPPALAVDESCGGGPLIRCAVRACPAGGPRPFVDHSRGLPGCAGARLRCAQVERLRQLGQEERVVARSGAGDSLPAVDEGRESPRQSPPSLSRWVPSLPPLPRELEEAELLGADQMLSPRFSPAVRCSTPGDSGFRRFRS